jgi:mono/diheme cytochrome c family protein
MELAALAVLLFMTIVTASVSSASSSHTQSQNSDMAALYKTRCARCHGADGKGKPDRTPDFTDPKWQSSRKDEDLVQIITEGKGEMPAYGESLSKDQINGLVAFIRSMAKTGQ